MAGVNEQRDPDAQHALDWIESGMPDSQVGHGPDAPQLTSEQLNDFEPASYVKEGEGGLVEVGRTIRGNIIYREPNGAGGHRYWSDAIGGGVVVYDTCLASVEEVEMAVRIEKEFQNGQR